MMLHSQSTLRSMSSLVGFLWLCCLVSAYYFRAFISLVRQSLGIKKTSVRGKIVVVTGAARGIGRAIVEEFAKQSAIVVLLDISCDVEKTADELTKQNYLVSSYQVDVTNYEQLQACFNKIVEKFGRVDVVVCNAGVLIGKTVVELSEKEIKKTFDVNTLGVIWTIKACLGHMMKRGNGHIVAMVSLSAISGVANIVDYSASKFAVQGFMEGLTDELRHTGKSDDIVTTCVFPSFCNTSLVVRSPLVPCSRFSHDIVTEKQIANKVIDAVSYRLRSVVVPQFAGLAQMIKYWLPWRAVRAMQDYLGAFFIQRKS